MLHRPPRDLALRDSVRRGNLMESLWYRCFWGDAVRLSRDQNQKQEYATTNGGVMFSTWISGATGRGADFIFIDDPHRLADAYSTVELENAVKYVRGTLFSRLNDPKRGAIVLIQQRLHENDLARELLNPSPEPETKAAEAKVEPKRTGYEMFTGDLRVFR